MGAAPYRQRPVIGWPWKPLEGAWARPGGNGLARQPQRLLPPLWRGLQPLVIKLDLGLELAPRAQLLAPGGRLVARGRLAPEAQLLAGLASVGRVVVELVAGARLVAGAICSSGSAATAVNCRSCPLTPVCG